MTNPLIDILGWLGSLLLIFGYLFVSRKKVEPDSFIYHFLNITGSLLLIINTFYYGAFPSTAVNIIWVFIGLFYILKSAKK
jgi:hypothetical protein